MSNQKEFVIRKGVLTKYNGPGGDVVVPEGVTSIGKKAFWECAVLTRITLPESVTEIENAAFYRCENLTEITLPTSVQQIGQWAFNGCAGLTRISLPESTAIGNGAFLDCRSLADENGMVIIHFTITSTLTALLNMTLLFNVSKLDLTFKSQFIHPFQDIK